MMVGWSGVWREGGRWEEGERVRARGGGGEEEEQQEDFLFFFRKKERKKREGEEKSSKKNRTFASQNLIASCGLSTLSMMALVASSRTWTSRPGPGGGSAPAMSPLAMAAAAASAAACAMPLPSPRGSKESSAPIERSNPTTEITSIDSRRSMLSTLTGAGWRAGAPEASALTSRMFWILSQQPEITSKADLIEAIEKALATPLRTAFQWPLE